MNVRRALALAALPGALGLVVQCASESTGIPPQPDAGVTTTKAVTTFAIDAIFLGEQDFYGAPSSVAWKQFGFNLDGRTTSANSSDVCHLRPGALSTLQIDGENGIDNSFGSSLLPTIETATSVPAPSDQQTALIRQGRWTLEMSVTGLSSDLQQTAVGLDTQAFVGERLDTTPAFDMTTDWPVLPSSLNDAGLASGALAHFSNVYVTNGTLVAEGAPQPIVLPLEFPVFSEQLYAFPLRINHAVIVFDTFSNRGIIGGVLDPTEAVTTLLDFLHAASPSTCAITASSPLAIEYLKAQDILSDGSNTPGADCNAISIGIGFTAKRIANPTRVGVEPVPMRDLCDAGVDASDGSDATTE